METASGIYRIVNTVNGKRYIGQSVRLCRDDVERSRRWIEHRADLRHGRHHNQHLQAAWRKYGESAFRFDVIVFCREYDLSGIEHMLLTTEPVPEYNIARDPESPWRGQKHTQEARDRIRAAKIGKPRPPELMEKLRQLSTGRRPSAETRERMSRAKRGRKQSPGAIEKSRVARSIPVEGVDADGNVVVAFPSAAAAQRAGYWSGNISTCINGRMKTYRGLRWRRATG